MMIRNVTLSVLCLLGGQLCFSAVPAEKPYGSEAPFLENPYGVDEATLTDEAGSAEHRDQVLMLDAIVALSLHTITQFDSELEGVHEAVHAYIAAQTDTSADVQDAAETAMERIDFLAESASKAVSAMREAEAELTASGEPYNDVTLAAMLSFVKNVDDEIARERRRLSSSLNEARYSIAADASE